MAENMCSIHRIHIQNYTPFLHKFSWINEKISITDRKGKLHRAGSFHCKKTLILKEISINLLSANRNFNRHKGLFVS